MGVLQWYFVLSFAVLFGYMAVAWMVSHDVFVMWEIMKQNGLYALVLYNGYIAFQTMLFFWFIQRSTRGSLKKLELDLTGLEGHYMFFVISYVQLLAQRPRLILLVHLLIMLDFTCQCFLKRLRQFPIAVSRPRLEQHMSLIIGETIGVVISFAARIWVGAALEKKLLPDQGLILNIGFEIGILNFFVLLIRQGIQIADLLEYGNSFWAYQLDAKIQSLVVIFEDLRYLSQFRFFIRHDGFITLYIRGMSLYRTLTHVYKSWRILGSLEEDLDDATQEEIDRNAVCIVCRDQMHVGDTKKLPCGHCLHLNCVQRWVVQKLTCPMCQYDLSQIRRRNDNEEASSEDAPSTEENEPEPSEDRDFAKSKVDMMIKQVQEAQKELRRIRGQLLALQEASNDAK